MAVEDIRISLQLLAESVENLERDIAAKEKERENAPKVAPAKSTAPQIDMFGGWTPKPSNDKNNAILAKKLDNTIDKIQNMLREGAI